MNSYYRRRPVSYGYGWWSLPGIVYATVTAILAALGAVIGTVLRFGWRYRSELAPLAVAAVVVYTAARWHVQHPAWAPAIAALTVALTAMLAVLPRRWLWRWPWLWHTTERVYVCVVVVLAGGWLSAAVWWGPDRNPLPGLGWWVTVVCAVPWWLHHRRRAKVRIERIIEGWPGVAEATGLAGTHIVSALGTTWGWAARVALPRGMTSRQVIERIPQLESGLGVRPGGVRVEPDPSYADRVTMRVIEADPHAHPIGYPGAEPSTVSRPVALGLFEDGSVVWVLLLRRNVLIGGIVDSGKSGIVNVILAALVACPDVVVWGIDLKGGMELNPWAPCLGRLATTPEAAVQLLRDAVTELEARAALLADQGERLWEPSSTSPALVVVVDEYAELPREAAPLTDSLVRRGRAVAVNLLAATQRPTQKAMGQGAVRSQMDVRIALRVRERADTDLILGSAMLSAGWHPDTLDAPGKFLISAREHTIPKPARAFHMTDQDVADTVARYAEHRPVWQPHLGTSAAEQDGNTRTDELGVDESGRGGVVPTSPDEWFWHAISQAPAEGVSVVDLMNITHKSRSWVYDHIAEYRRAGRITRSSWGRWRPVDPADTGLGEQLPTDMTDRDEHAA